MFSNSTILTRSLSKGKVRCPSFLLQRLGTEKARAKHKELVKTKMAALESALVAALEAARLTQYGTKNGESWHKDIPSTSSLPVVLSSITAQTYAKKGPGASMRANMNALNQVPHAKLPSVVMRL